MHLGYYKQRHWVVLHFIQFSLLNLDLTLFCLGLWILRFVAFGLEMEFGKTWWFLFKYLVVFKFLFCFFFKKNRWPWAKHSVNVIWKIQWSESSSPIPVPFYVNRVFYFVGNGQWQPFSRSVPCKYRFMHSFIIVLY